MELGSAGSSSNSSSSGSSSDSLNGLKFGKKIYFENANNNGPGVGSSSSSASGGGGGRPPTAPAKKRRAGVGSGGGGEPPRCQVEGCKLDLSGAKAYYSRHKVCGMHSKSPKVVVSGLEQRFCQQCSRFHLLPEFDQGKRSCRRRLAGHNERRRKPPPGNLLSARFGNLSSPFLVAAENNGRSGSFVLDFSKYPARTGTDPWLQNTRSSDRSVDYQQTTNMGKYPPPTWHHQNTESSPSEIQVQGSTARASYSENPSGESFNGLSACSRALSLLSNQQQQSPLGSSSRDHRFSNLAINGYANANVTVTTTTTTTTTTHCDSIDGFSSPSFWGFKGSNECNSSSSSHEMHPDLGLGHHHHHQLSQPATSCQYSEDIDLAQQSERDYLMLDHSRGYDSSLHNMHWSL